ncbi:hypothetical protein [Paenibacillus macquariensis]|uniref:Uncharacterized protein n=1 Tax=Paenibacillus macquariensis TaxID=948756 RepID=A0ABY1K7P7_9BACL|nr:hypothetical protein [Paenibacillus macquariensis]MEC0091124.1 hypothetical protein [Paenibacillus macquariensis]OAB33692.1 hypothetical protein PMSM_13780 [Paenibacillus macquariensis subsp. macquariensis]SIR37832.1 hypothetical protein SAMN05421578_11274 [Paenibacillus macquariensis]
MRRYWISIVLSAFIIVGLGTYYVYGAVVDFPGYKISKVSGDVNEGSKISVQGNFANGGRYQLLIATAEGSDYPNRRSAYSQFFSGTRPWMNDQADIRQILNDHRSFMRSKGNINSFYKDDEWIIYADAVFNNAFGVKSEIVLSIDTLNQTSGVVKHYETIVEDPMDYSQIFVEDVQLIGEQIHMFIGQHSKTNQNKGNSNSSKVEYHDYVVDMNSGALMNNISLALGDNTKDNVELFDRSIMNTIYSAPSDHAILIVYDEQKRVNDYMGIIDEHLYSYAYKTGVLTDLSDTMLKAGIDDIGDIRLDGHILTILNYEEDFIKLSRYNIDTEKVTNEDISLSAQQLGAEKIIMGTTKNNKLYILFYKNDIPKVAVLDATNGAILYTGEVVYEGEASESKWTMNTEGRLYMQIAD